MDLDDFKEVGLQKNSILKNSATSDALSFVDNVWYAETNRRGRWMDLIGDYAGNELFVVDGTHVSSSAQDDFMISVLGDSLLQIVLDDPLLALGNGADGKAISDQRILSG